MVYCITSLNRMEDDDFLLYQKGIKLIQQEIVKSNDPEALRKWPECIYNFINDASLRTNLYDDFQKGQHAIVMMRTLEGWLGQQAITPTFGNLIQLFRELRLNTLCDMLLANASKIKEAQCTNIFGVEQGCRRNAWFVMSDPIPITNFVGRVDDLEKLHELVTSNRNDKDSSIALLASLHGIGGIGKTTLALKYACKYSEYFDGNVIWINSEKFDSMRRSFKNVAEELKLEISKTKQDLKVFTKAVYKAFIGSKCLFIFDNVEDFNGPNGIEPFLPIGVIGKPYLLLTSRRRDCFPTKRILSLDVLSRLDSIELIKEYIPGATDEIADSLAERLARVPLAIHQAISYIKKSLPEHSRLSETEVFNKISNFLEEYERNSNRILNSDFLGGDGYAKNIYSICEMSLQKMEHEEGGKLAKHLLRYISFLHPECIKLDFVLKLDYGFESIWDKLQAVIPWRTVKDTDPNMTVGLLCSYSLIDIKVTERTTIKVHRLVQDVIRCMLRQKEELVYVKRLLACLTKEEYSENLSHWISIKQLCRFDASKDMLESELQLVVSTS